MKFLKLLFASLLVGFGVYFLLTTDFKKFTISPLGEIIVTPTQTPKIPPTRIRISKLNLDIAVKAATVSGNTWDMFDDAIAWLSTSAVPGQGNVIVYGHNRKHLFRDLYTLNIGDLIELEQKGAWVPYKVTESKKIKATDIASILSDQNRLTLYTCEGSFDQKRRVLYAEPE